MPIKTTKRDLEETRKYLENTKEDLEKSILYFGNKYKEEREIWVLKEFSKYLFGNVNESYIRVSNDEPNDVFYKDIGFQIKEILTEKRCRHAEYKNILNHTNKAIDYINNLTNRMKNNLERVNEEEEEEIYKMLKNISKPYNHICIPISEKLSIIRKKLKHYRRKYRDTTQNINILLYLNIENTNYTSEPTNTYSIKEELNNWLSVSLVTNNCATILSCNEDNSPMKPLVGLIY